MATLNCERFESRSEESLPQEMCRLRHGLNESCLLNVFDYLDESDLINLCAVESYYKELIMKWTVKRKLINLRDHGKQLEYFQTFGKSIRKLKVFTSSFTAMLTRIVKYCEPGTLTEIYLQINDIDDKDLERADAVDSLNCLTNASMPFFANLRKLKFETYKNNDPNGVLTNFLTKVTTAASNLQSLHLSNAELRDSWLQNMQSLSELRFFWTLEPSFVNLFRDWRASPRLKVFEFQHRLKDVTAVYDVLADLCPGLEKFSDIDVSMSNPYQRFDELLIIRYNFLTKFPHLNCVALMSYTFCGSDLYFPLVSLAKTNISKLKVLMNFTRPIIVDDETKAEIMRRPLPQFAGLHSIEIEIWDQNDYIYDLGGQWTQCDLRCQFLFHFVKQVKHLQCFTFSGGILTNMDSVLEFAPYIRVLDISRTLCLSPEKLDMVPRIVQKLRTARQLYDGKNNHHVLHLILQDDVEVHRFGKNNDWKDILNFTFTSMSRWRQF